ncbi:MAG: hypothetical protein ACI9RO_000461 [Alteromonas macleodii]
MPWVLHSPNISSLTSARVSTCTKATSQGFFCMARKTRNDKESSQPSPMGITGSLRSHNKSLKNLKCIDRTIAKICIFQAVKRRSASLNIVGQDISAFLAQLFWPKPCARSTTFPISIWMPTNPKSRPSTLDTSGNGMNLLSP